MTAKSDFNIAVLGRQCIEETEMFDVANMELEQGQLDLLKAITTAASSVPAAAAGKKQNGRPVERRFACGRGAFHQ